MNRNKIRLAILAATLVYGSPAIAQQQKKPNIILILVDDMGYSDLGSYGSEIHTPNLDKLAYQGIRLQQFYNNSICAPTRASVITGQYPHKAGIGYFNVNLGLPAYQGYLNKESLTFAEVLRQGGYQTYLSGKWHVGDDSTDNERPNQRGFDHFFGFLGGASSYLYPTKALKGFREPGSFFEDDKLVSYRNDPDFYATDVITDHAVQYVQDASKTSKPFFLYLAYNAPHWPLQARQQDIDKYKGVYDIGWDSLRIKRFQKQKELGIVSQNATLSVKDTDIPDWKDLTYDEQAFWAKKMEIYAAMVDRLDQGVGKVLDALNTTGQLDNTLIVFLSDNGAPVEDVSHLGGQVANGGPVGTAGSFQSQGKNWSYASNTPFRGYKSYAYEGGINTPFIAWFPRQIKAGTIVQGDGHIIDLAPTFYDVAGIAYPARLNSSKPFALPGTSLKKVLFSREPLSERPLFWERAGNRAVQLGRWKLVSIFPSYQWELYDLQTDGGETSNIAAKNPALVNKLSRLYFDWAKENGVVDFNTIKPKRPLLPTPDGKGVQAY
ncbi:MAG: arylsulfatase [Chitinophagaceae bacterium]